MNRLYNAIPFSKTLSLCVCWVAALLVKRFPLLKTSPAKIIRSLWRYCSLKPPPKEFAGAKEQRILLQHSEKKANEVRDQRVNLTRLRGGSASLAKAYKRRIAAGDYPADDEATREMKQANIDSLVAAGYPCTVNDSWFLTDFLHIGSHTQAVG
ncbi:hypothetical protein DL95DRAFT_410063 [Leptodontidium sp. 2 PMI_412]|nr:hypothetical protein DL95DRAFT_410063 [Leptodontidium sp. 2 PMI_412]